MRFLLAFFAGVPLGLLDGALLVATGKSSAERKRNSSSDCRR